jgi:cytochrome c2
MIAPKNKDIEMPKRSSPRKSSKTIKTDTSRRRAYKISLYGVAALFGLVIVWAGIGTIARTYEFWDDDKDRGAIPLGSDILGDRYTEVRYLNQNWDESDSLWFYNTTQGSNLLPYDFFLVLEQSNAETLFRDNENINRYRYLAQKPTFSNPDGLAVGMTRDKYHGKSYMGFTCAACHTTQLNYDGVGIRIDGGPAMSDMETFMVDLAKAMYTTLENDEKRARFVAAVLKKGDYDSEQEILADLEKYAQRIKTYTIVNNPRDTKRPLTTYGYARLDAFGRIFNRVLEHIMSADQLRILLADTLPADEVAKVMEGVKPILSGDDRDHIIERTQEFMSPKQIIALRNKMYNPADAPVSYPFLWDIPQHDFVQWNGIVNNSGIGPMGRNAGQVIGVFATLDWSEKEGISLSSVLGGQGFGDTHIKFQSSIDIRNLRRVEDHLRKLQSPVWPETILPRIDPARAANGRALFVRYCESCHEQIDRSSDSRRVVAMMTKVESVKTDPKMVDNSVGYRGYSGILRNQYVGTGLGNILITQQAPVAALLTASTANVVTTPDPDKWFIQRWAEWLFDIARTYFHNEVRPSIKRGDYNPDNTANPFSSLRSYKSRPLNGIWATAPYLHNGSVPTLYHLLLPKKRAGDPAGGEYRPDTFVVGSREFDTQYVGLKWQGYEGFAYRTNIPGNSNEGHEYAAGRTPQPDGSKPPPLNKEQRLDLLEYLKTL